MAVQSNVRASGHIHRTERKHKHKATDESLPGEACAVRSIAKQPAARRRGRTIARKQQRTEVGSGTSGLVAVGEIAAKSLASQ